MSRCIRDTGCKRRASSLTIGKAPTGLAAVLVFNYVDHSPVGLCYCCVMSNE